MEKDSESLIVLYDANSRLSHRTDTLSKLSMVFQFDGELFRSRVYERACPSLLVDAFYSSTKKYKQCFEAGPKYEAGNESIVL